MDERTNKKCIVCGKQLPCNIMNMDCTGIHCKDCYACKGNSYELCKCNHHDLLIVALDKIASLEAELVQLRKDNIKLIEWYNI